MCVVKRGGEKNRIVLQTSMSGYAAWKRAHIQSRLLGVEPTKSNKMEMETQNEPTNAKKRDMEMDMQMNEERNEKNKKRKESELIVEMADGEYWDSVEVKVKTPPKGSYARKIGAYDVRVGTWQNGAKYN
jgi:formylmethanofuran dehydrogenase subunit E